MVRIKWIDSAIIDVESIKNFIAQHSVKYATLQVNQIFEMVEMLRDHLYIGRILPDWNDESLRYLIKGKYRIIYRIIDKHEVHILRVWHNSKPFDPDNDLFFDY